MTSIGIVVNCFFGKWPWPGWAELFLETCRRNPTVDFFVVTNHEQARRFAGGNIHVVPMELDTLRKLTSERVGFEVAIPYRYKLIDFKPACGVIFEELVGEYDFFGYCDVDVVFGDIRSFLTEEMLARYDVISARAHFPSGNCTLFRRGLERLYERSRDYRRVFTSERALAFDECGWGLHHPLLTGSSFAEVAGKARIDSMMHVLDRSPDVRVHYGGLCDEYLPPVYGRRSLRQKLLWEDGKLHDLESGQELMYYHLNMLKYDPRFYVPNWKQPPRAFILSRKGAVWVGERTLRQRLAAVVSRQWWVITRGIPYVYRSTRKELSRLRRRVSALAGGTQGRPSAATS